MPSLRKIVKERTGIDVARCQACLDCEIQIPEEQDIPLGALVQMILMNDPEVLTCNTLWSDKVLQAARGVCHHGLDLPTIMRALRQEATDRNLI